MKKLLLLYLVTIVLLLSGYTYINAQVTVGSTKLPENFSNLELISESKGLRLPQMTTEQRDAMTDADFMANPLSRGLSFFNMDTKCVETWNGTKWIDNCDPTPLIPEYIYPEDISGDYLLVGCECFEMMQIEYYDEAFYKYRLEVNGANSNVKFYVVEDSKELVQSLTQTTLPSGDYEAVIAFRSNVNKIVMKGESGSFTVLAQYFDGNKFTQSSISVTVQDAICKN